MYIYTYICIRQVVPHKVKTYKGDYDTFEKTKGELLKNQIKEYINEANQKM